MCIVWGFHDSGVLTFEEFKQYQSGKQLPLQTLSTKELRAAGWQGPNPWATCWLEQSASNN